MTTKDLSPDVNVCHACAGGALKIKRHGRIQHLATFDRKPVWMDCVADRKLTPSEAKIIKSVILEEALEIAVSSPLWLRNDEDWRKVRAAFMLLAGSR